MAPRRSPSSSSTRQGSFAPSNDVASFKDLLLFEERLKQNAALLRSRKRKYEVFLAILLVTIVVLTHKSFLRPSPTPSLHYLHLSLLPVAVVTLLLFFASGMYAERIGYANRYVPHANRALRSLNMHLNMRVQPTPLIPFVPFPFSLLLPSAPTPPSGIQGPPSSSSTRSSAAPPPSSSSSSTPTTSKPTKSTTSSTSLSNPLTLRASIPPTKNPRGELIFSSRVDRAFRDGYERYRGMFERRREERYRETRAGKGGLMGIWWRLLGYRKKPVAQPGGSPGEMGGGRLRNGTSPPGSSKQSRTPSPSGLGTGSSSSSIGRGGGNSTTTKRRPGLPRGTGSGSGSSSQTSIVSNTSSSSTIVPTTTTTSTTPPSSSSPLLRHSQPRSSASSIPETEVVLDVGKAVGERLQMMSRSQSERGVGREQGNGSPNRARAESFSFLLNSGGGSSSEGEGAGGMGSWSGRRGG
ncbi:Spo7-like protein-domain-containing protein [Mrakia frigida]|uniref:Nem1-Spo7 phosphatase regulatory subunit SPO7 n=1 Tax=Mrakia frigida TaxID=29902 RepID=UPI003FCC0BD6